MKVEVVLCHLSALTSFCAWFMIWTMRVSMLIISWKMDLAREVGLLRTHLTTVSRKSLTNFWCWTWRGVAGRMMVAGVGLMVVGRILVTLLYWSA